MNDHHRIDVQFTSDPSPELTVTEAELVLSATTSPIYSVVWVFAGIDDLVQQGWKPAIHFLQKNAQDEPLYTGPFENLSATQSCVIATGNNGRTGSFTYQAVLIPPAKRDSDESDKRVRSEENQLTNEVANVRRAVIEIRHSGGNLLQFSHQDVAYVAGQSILWEVVEPPPEGGAFYPRLYFLDGPEGMNPYFGPFGSIDVRDNSILATGSSNLEPGLYKYLFQLLSVEGDKVLFKSTRDPTIDDQGDIGAAGGQRPAAVRYESRSAD